VQLTNWPLRDDALGAWLLIALEIVVVVAAGVMAQNLLVGVLAWLALTVTTWRMFVPTQYELGPKGVTETILGRRRRIPWSAIGRCQVCRFGIVLLPTADAQPLALLRGIYLRWGTQRDALVAITRYYLGSRFVE
jgi:hypothetical protein